MSRFSVFAVIATVIGTVLAPGPAASAQSRVEREALRDLGVAVRSRDPGGFMAAARKALGPDGGSARALGEVVEGFAALAEGISDDAEAYYHLHMDTAKLLGRTKSPEAVVEMRKLLGKSRSWWSRLILLDAASLHGEIDILESAFTALGDKAPEVVRRSLFYLRHIDSSPKSFDEKVAAVDRILERYLEVDDEKSFKGSEWDRTRLAFRSAMTAILEVSLPAAADYRNYLSVRRDRPDLFDPAERREGGLTRLTLFGTEVTGKNIAFVIDVSGSMMATDKITIEPEDDEPGTTVVVGSEEEKKLLAAKIESRRRITRAKRELAKVVRALPSDVKFNIIAYSSDVRPWKKGLVACKDAARKAAVEWIEEMRAEGVTVTDMAVEEAFGDLAVDTIYLITDGAPTHVGSSGPDRPVDADDLIRIIHERVGILNFLRGVRVFTLGFPDAEEEFLKKLSADNSGSYAPIR